MSGEQKNKEAWSRFVHPNQVVPLKLIHLQGHQSCALRSPNQTYAGAVCPKKDNSTYEYLQRVSVLRNLEGQRKRKVSQQGEEEEVREAQVVQNSASPGSMSIPLHTV